MVVVLVVLMAQEVVVAFLIIFTQHAFLLNLTRTKYFLLLLIEIFPW